MANENKCPHCGKPVPTTALAGICPECMLKAGVVETGELGPGGTVVARQPPQPTPRVEEIAPHFPQLEILECLGRGGMGAVYKARQPKLDRFVALKILSRNRDNGTPDAEFAERFQREARALARLNHPDIVAVYDFGEAGGYHYLLMEYVDGLTLRQLLQTRKLSPEEALTIVPKICEALQFAHERGIVHRDIKPENILLDKQGQVKIADFGIAKIVGQPAQAALTQDKQVIGTPHYMAPEQVEKPQTVDHRADIFSLGVVFYEMLTGELPLGNFQPPSRKVQVDVRLDEVVMHALEKEPERRYQHASEVKTDVETIAHTPLSPSVAQEVALPRPSPVPNAWEAALIGIGLTVFIALLVALPTVSSSVRPVLAVVTIVGLIICLLTLAGWWPAPSFLIPDSGFSSRNLPGRRPAPSPTASLGGAKVIPISAKVGFAWIVLALMVFGWFAIWTFLDQDVTSALRAIPVLQFGFVGAVISTICGWMAVHKIGQSQGKLGGLGLAVFDGLLYPLLTLDAFIFGVLHALTGNAFQGGYLALALLISFVFDWRIAWWVWRAVNRSPSSAVQPSTASRADEGVLAKARQEVKAPASWLVATGILNWLAIPLTFLATAGVVSQSQSRGAYMIFIPLAAFVLSAVMIFAALKMKRLEMFGLAVAGSILAILVTPGNAVGLPVGIWSLVVLYRREVREAFTKNPARSATPRRPARPWWKRWWAQVAIAAFLASIVLGCFLQPFMAVTDAAAPEVPRGSRFLVWKLTRYFSPGDLIAYKFERRANVGRVIRDQVNGIQVSRNGEADALVPREAVLGKVVSVYWRAGGRPDLTVTGMVTEAGTGAPIPGARITDNFYGRGATESPRGVWTDANGHYALHTWPEEHTLSASAPGHETKLATLTTSLWGRERTGRMDFQLQTVTNPATAVTVSSPAVPPVVIETIPESGATNVDPGLTELRVTFSKRMRDGSWAWTIWGEENFPEKTGEPRYLPDGRTCVLPVKLKPGKLYATWLNSEYHQGFTDTNRQPAVPYLLIFETRK